MDKQTGMLNQCLNGQRHIYSTHGKCWSHTHFGEKRHLDREWIDHMCTEGPGSYADSLEGKGWTGYLRRPHSQTSRSQPAPSPSLLWTFPQAGAGHLAWWGKNKKRWRRYLIPISLQVILKIASICTVLITSNSSNTIDRRLLSIAMTGTILSTNGEKKIWKGKGNCSKLQSY